MQTGAACYVCVQHSTCHFMLLCYALLFCMKLFYANMLLHSFVQYTLVVQGLAIAIKGQRAA